MDNFSLENRPMSADETIMAISFIMQECHAMGANDSEMPELSKLIEDVREGKIDPAKALNRAETIKTSKFGYN